MSSSFFPPSVNIPRTYLNFGTCFRSSTSILILIFSESLEQTITSVFFKYTQTFLVLGAAGRVQKSYLITGLARSLGIQEVEAPRVSINWKMKV
jgi:hypothetical protein